MQLFSLVIPRTPKRRTQFRRWTTQRLREYLIQGSPVNQQRLQQLQQIIQLIHQTGKHA
jgi:hypothetical protein